MFSFSKHFVFLTLELSIQYLSMESYFCEKNYLWSFKITKREFVIIGSPSYKFFPYFGFVPCLLCRGDCVRKRSCVLPVLSCNSSVEVPLWKVLCGRSENPSVWRRGHRVVARILKHLCLRLIHYISTLSLFISCIALHCSYYIRAWYWLCAHTCVEPRELLIAPQLLV